MSSAAARRMSAPGAYRRLLKSCHGACAASGLDAASMQHYVHQRFTQIALSPLRFDGTASPQIKKDKIHDAVLIADCFDSVQGNTELASILQILSAGVGNEPLRRNLERGFFDLVHHETAKEARNEADEDSSSERQNQLMQQAVAPYASRLLELHDPRIAAAPPSRNAVSVHVVDHGTETLVLEIDDSLNKQVFYVMSKEPQLDAEDLEPMGHEESDGESSAARGGGEEVEVMRPETLRNTTIHAEFYSIAQRLYESAMKETPMHRSRSSVVVGYGRGGAVAVSVALLLASQDFNVRNAISFGAPKCLTHFMERQVFSITPIRVVAAGDGRVDMPISSSEGDPFVHVGEILVMEQRQESSCGSSSDNPMQDDNTENKNDDRYSLVAYCEMLHSQSTLLTYAEGDEVWDDGPKRQMMDNWAASSQATANSAHTGADQPPQ